MMLSIGKKMNDVSDYDNQFKELMDQINYASVRLIRKRWNLSQYFKHMADVFDYLDLPEDAQEHRELADDWKVKNIEV